MKKICLVVMMAILLAGAGAAVLSGPAAAQVYSYPAPPQNLYATPWVGPNTPWVYYRGDWFLNGVLYYFFGNQYGWAPYYAYPPTYVVRPNNWYAPKWHAWYQGNPHYWDNFQRQYPYWYGHKVGHRYNENFYNTHHRGQGGGWHKGYHDGPHGGPHHGGPGSPGGPGGPRPQDGHGPRHD